MSSVQRRVEVYFNLLSVVAGVLLLALSVLVAVWKRSEFTSRATSQIIELESLDLVFLTELVNHDFVGQDGMRFKLTGSESDPFFTYPENWARVDVEISGREISWSWVVWRVHAISNLQMRRDIEAELNRKWSCSNTRVAFFNVIGECHTDYRGQSPSLVFPLPPLPPTSLPFDPHERIERYAKGR